MRPDSVMIFAAGFGTRMGPLTRDLPKPLIRLGGRTLLDRTRALAEEAGITRHVVNTHYLPEKIHAHLAGTGVILSDEPGEILDTGGGLKAALPHFGEGPVFTANPDVAWRGPNPFRHLAGDWTDAVDALLLTVPVSRAGGRDRGDFARDGSGRLSRRGDFVYTGLQIIRPAVVAAAEGRAFSLNLVWDRLIAQGRLGSSVYPGHWCDVGSPEGLARAEALIAQSA